MNIFNYVIRVVELSGSICKASSSLGHKMANVQLLCDNNPILHYKIIF